MQKLLYLILFSLIPFLISDSTHNSAVKDVKYIYKIPPNSHYLINLTSSPNQTFLYKPPENLKKNAKITFIINPISMDSSPLSLDLDIQVRKQANSTVRESIKNCFDIANETCTFQTFALESYILENKTQLYLKFQCKSLPCLFKILVLESKEVKLPPKESHIFYFKRSKSEIFNISIPEKNSFDRIVLIVSYTKHKDLKDFSLTPSLSFNSSHNDSCIVYQEATKLILILKNTIEDLPYGNELSIELVSQKLGLYFEIHYAIYYGITELFYDNLFYDNIDEKRFVAYKIKINNEINQIYFDLKNQFGDKKSLIVSTPAIIEKLFKNEITVNYFFFEHPSYLSNIDNELSNILMKTEFQPDSDGFIYILVAPNLGCFSLQISIKNQRIIPLKLGFYERKKIQNSEIQNFEIQVDSEGNKIIVDFSMEYGNADLHIKTCGSRCDLVDMTSLPSENFIESITSKEHRLIQFQPKCDNKVLIANLCKYLIVIIGNSTLSLSSKYHILVKQGDQITDLPENRPVGLFLEKDIDYYCRFWLEQDLTLQEISFSINSISASFYIGTSFQCAKDPTCNDLTKGDSSHPISEFLGDHASQNLVYYIRIRGVKTAKAIFYVEVVRKDQPSIINLYEGQSFVGVLDQDRTSQLYSFKVDLKENSSIFVNLNSNAESLIMYMSDHHSIIKKQTFLKNFYKSYHWKSKNGKITIHPSHKHYSKSMTYYILVTHKTNLQISTKDPTHELEVISYYIMFSTEKSLKNLQNNVPFYDKIQSNQTTFFKIYVNPKSEEMVITKFLMRSSMNSVLEQQDLNMMISPTPFEAVNLTNVLNLTRLFTDEKTGSIFNSFHFTKEILTELCSNAKHKYKKICPLYISIYNRGKFELLYGVSVNIKGMATELFDGVENAVSLSEFSGFKEKRFYYKINDVFENIDVFSEADFGTSYDVSVMFLDHRQEKINVFDYKTVEDSFFYSRNKSIHSIQIPKEQILGFCKLHCMLIVVVSLPKNLEELQKKNYFVQSELIYVLVTNKMDVLHEGRHLIFDLKIKQMKYFSYALNDFLQNYNYNDSLVISLTPLSGIAYFYAIESNNSYQNFPDSNNAQFYSYQSHITIKKNSLISKFDEFENPQLIIGIYSYEGGKFIIDLIQNNLVSIYLNYPLNVLILANEERAYEFTTYNYENGYQIRFFVDFGQGKLLVFKIEDNKLLDEIIFNGAPLFNQTLTENALNTITMNYDDPNLCWGCNYYILVQATTDVQGVLSLQEKGGVKQLLINSLFFDNINGGDSGLYKIYIPLDKKTELIMNIYSGSAILKGGISDGYTDFNYNLEADAVSANYQKLIIPVEEVVKFYKSSLEGLGIKERDADTYFKTREIVLNLKITSVLGFSANYSLEVYSSENIRFLKEGIIVYTQTNASQKTVFVYDKHSVKLTNTSNKSKNINIDKPHLLIKSLDSASLNLEINASFTENKFDYSVSKLNSQAIALTLLSSSRDSLEYSIPIDKIGLFTFEINNMNKKFDIEYYLIISSDKLITLPYDISMSVSLPKNGVKYYETFIPKKGVLALEILECYGSVKVSRTNSYQNLMNKKGILEEFDVLKDVDSVNYYKVKKPEAFYFMIKSTGEKFTNIQLTMKFYDSLNQIPHKNLKVPESGSIDYVLKGNDVSLNFSPIVCTKCNKQIIDNVIITYELIIGNSLFDVDSIGKCRIGYPEFYLKKLKKDEEAEIITENVTVLEMITGKIQSIYKKTDKIVFDFVHNFESFESKLKEKGFSHFFTIRAQISNYPQISNETVQKILPSFDLFYETLELNFKENIDKESEKVISEVENAKKVLESSNLNYQKMLIIAIIVIILLLICVVLACYYDRMKKVRSGLIHYQLDDSRDARRPVRLGESSDKLELEMETKNLSTNKFNPDNF